MITDMVAAKIAKLMINAKTRTLVAKIVKAALAEQVRNIVITLEDDDNADGAELVAANF